ncbi:hypothetical protein [Actinoplanes auranticolor]|uniref:Uncharacterized protein n=1 Tax=Actinoplanes auranticolor TaxID=47988 RepID=A0A919S7B3_9ACTN|nr:hypothetical protein [Actinoplanes auranticolor]GIM64604.1 hypothetical protein Aau02nite_11530 [Actinoplanes auranticolor]
MLPSAPLAAVVRRFPLLGRPRPACPALTLRFREIEHAVETARDKAEDGMADAAHALNKAALIASDSGMADLARHLCWQHIDAHRRLPRPLTVLEGRYLLEPVLNLARLDLRANDGNTAMHLLKAMFHAVIRGTDLVVSAQTLPTANLVGATSEHRELREWTWLQLIGEGVRALGLAGRWAEAAEHARRYKGIGIHLMEGRQAAIIAHCVAGKLAEGRASLAQSDPTQPWEQEVAACLQIMCTDPTDALMSPYLTAAVARYSARKPMAGYASYHARLGLTIATLAHTISPDVAPELLNRAAEDAIDSADGYAARDVLSFRESIEGITDDQRSNLSRLAAESGLGVGKLPQSSLLRLTTAATDAAAVLKSALSLR